MLASAFLVVSALSAAADQIESRMPETARGTVCWPLHFAGITLGVTNDSQVRRLVGDGVYRRSEGDTGGRYFIDKGHRATLHVVMYTDLVVGELTVTDGINSSLQKTEQGKATSKFFDPNEGFGNWHALHLGSSKADVLENLGEPARRNTDDVWRYSTSCACEIPQSFTVYFREGHLFQIVFSAPAG